ncbi:type II toxin-antitoxin system RelE/ParE family toxin [Cronobacter sp. EKM101R]|uniref:type II toxin-antitoxin system RelE/ParE family toxin n=1 Tax=Cronobacter TaxID=413496 RepID=UPI0013ED3F5B|nr:MULTISPECIES: type II toxin-antitoxin system RelE/ParE family toxin [Cronobacter]KAF6589108.1 type II toxin-antitoxin system RelE/ParE family toxin [Cronobacter sp. EKM101R]KAF6592409.1 type II toxin-antitoxin system RelE/ParE family toxin [Cronobacter sp. EKM102R]MDK1185202.1 type II toxin-antitoxin system RelE/ParE family toxin [Cronobacter turicensis]MDK1205083.1 type II toxin-antitoxin system RelE/ParE family toxin [Cronobacter turicensis]MDK1216817.1 type II toxin-antitoxin system RelE
MIKSWKHKGLQQFFEHGSAAGINPQHAKRLRVRLRVIDLAETIDDINLSGYRLHPLHGDRAGIWSVTVSGNWRITFEFRDGNAYVLNYEDYH